MGAPPGETPPQPVLDGASERLVQLMVKLNLLSFKPNDANVAIAHYM